MASSRIFSVFNRNLSWVGFLREFRFRVFGLITWIPAAIFFNGNVGEVTWIYGLSMYPYLNTSYNEDLKKDLCWNNKWKPTRNLDRGMLISFQSPFHPEKLAIKRVIALEGDTVYTRAPCPHPRVQIPVNHVWVEGDNRDNSLDSNSYGPIPMSLIQGKITHVLLPWKSSGPINWRQFKGKTRVVRGRREDAPNWD